VIYIEFFLIVCLSVTVKWLAVKIASEMTRLYCVEWGVKLYSIKCKDSSGHQWASSSRTSTLPVPVPPSCLGVSVRFSRLFKPPHLKSRIFCQWIAVLVMIHLLCVYCYIEQLLFREEGWCPWLNPQFWQSGCSTSVWKMERRSILRRSLFSSVCLETRWETCVMKVQ